MGYKPRPQAKSGSIKLLSMFFLELFVNNVSSGNASCKCCNALYIGRSSSNILTFYTATQSHAEVLTLVQITTDRC